MSATSLILLAHGARDPEWSRPLERLREAISQRHAGAVGVAFLEFMTPDLPTAIDTAVAQGARSLVVLPVFLAQGGHVKRDLPVMLDAALQRHPQLTIRLELAIGEAQPVIDAMADWALQTLR